MANQPDCATFTWAPHMLTKVYWCPLHSKRNRRGQPKCNHAWKFIDFSDVSIINQVQVAPAANLFTHVQSDGVILNHHGALTNPVVPHSFPNLVEEILNDNVIDMFIRGTNMYGLTDTRYVQFTEPPGNVLFV